MVLYGALAMKNKSLSIPYCISHFHVEINSSISAYEYDQKPIITYYLVNEIYFFDNKKIYSIDTHRN